MLNARFKFEATCTVQNNEATCTVKNSEATFFKENSQNHHDCLCGNNILF